jgi:uncharacterized protein (TIGR03435 family)
MKTLRIIATADIIVFAAAVAFGQTPAPPAFEVASIKEHRTLENGGGFFPTPGHLTVENRSLKNLIESAYRLKTYQLSGWPRWAETERYDITAKAEGNANFTQMMLMIQTLLVNRFQLKFHREPKEYAGYALVVAKGGPKFHEGRDLKSDDPRRGTLTNPDKFNSAKIDIPYFANYISGILRVPVLDRTDLKGNYEITLVFTPDGAEPVDPTAPSSASLITAVQEQLGLKLESQKIPIEIFVVDHVARPAEN